MHIICFIYLCTEEKCSSHKKYSAANTLIGTGQHYEICDAKQWNEHKQLEKEKNNKRKYKKKCLFGAPRNVFKNAKKNTYRLRCLAILTCFNRICWTQFCNQYLRPNKYSWNEIVNFYLLLNCCIVGFFHFSDKFSYAIFFILLLYIYLLCILSGFHFIFTTFEASEF